MGIIDRTFRLTNEAGGLGLSCGPFGLSLAGVPLLHKSEAGFAPRSPEEIGALVKAAYGAEADAPALFPGLDAVARALNRGDLAHAMTVAVLTRLPELEWEGAARLATAEQQLRKYRPGEPRDWHGRWTDDAGADVSGQDLLPENPIDSDIEEAGSVHSQPPAPAAAAHDDAGDGGDEEPPDDRPPLERKYDDLGPVAFARQAILFGEQLSRQGKSLTPEEQQAARAEYDFLQSRLSFWLGYDNKPFEAQANLISAALALYQGAMVGGIVPVGGKHDGIPQSMLVAGIGAMAFDDSQPGFPLRRPSTGTSFEGEVVPSERPSRSEGIGDVAEEQPPSGRLGDVAHNAEVEIDWDGGIVGQGIPWEGYVAKQYPNAQKLAPGSKAFDHFDQMSGEAISDKTLNTITYSYIDNPQRIYGKLAGYVNKVADYEPRASIDVRPSLITSKTLQLAVPEYTSEEQWQYIDRAVQYGKSRGVSVIVTRIRSTARSGRN